MKKYIDQKEMEQIKEWRQKEKFHEMARIGNLPKHTDISVWVNDKGEEREEPHFHLRFPGGEVLRIKFKDLKGMDKKELDSSLRKEFIKWLKMPNKKDKDVSNIRVALIIWNSQEFNSRIVKLKDLKWYNEV